jgi:hypothetical protein
MVSIAKLRRDTRPSFKSNHCITRWADPDKHIQEDHKTRLTAFLRTIAICTSLAPVKLMSKNTPEETKDQWRSVKTVGSVLQRTQRNFGT